MMTQIGTVIPGMLLNLSKDERLTKFDWQTNDLGKIELCDPSGKPYPIRVTGSYNTKKDMQLAMFTVTVNNSPMGHYATDKDVKPALTGIVKLESTEDYFTHLQDFIEAVQHCFVYDDPGYAIFEFDLVRAWLTRVEGVSRSNPMTAVFDMMGFLTSKPITLGWQGTPPERPEIWLNARRWNLAKPTSVPKMDGPSHKAFGDFSREVHKLCLELGLSHSLTWDNDLKEWELVTGSSDDVPRANFTYADLGMVFFETFNFLYSFVEKKYAEEA
jgi:hypothetical protein